MAKELKVVKPFLMMEPGDILTLSEDGKSYVSTVNDEYHSDSDGDNIWSTYTSTFTISVDQAKSMIVNGLLREVKEENQFVNIFDEIDRLLALYSKDLASVDIDCKDQPACLKTERITVLNNLIKLLNHLKDLKR